MKEKDNPIEKKAAAMEGYIAEIDHFATLLRNQQNDIEKLTAEMDAAKMAYDKAKHAVSEAKDFEHSTVSLLLKFVRPGSIDILPLFDTMEAPDEKKHGAKSDEWRKEPITSLNLSALAMKSLVAVDIVLVGQLQDRVLAGPAWAKDIAGITDAVAQAIEAKLHQFIVEKSA